MPLTDEQLSDMQDKVNQLWTQRVEDQKRMGGIEQAHKEITNGSPPTAIPPAHVVAKVEEDHPHAKHKRG